jgi:hypothetical protein
MTQSTGFDNVVFLRPPLPTATTEFETHLAELEAFIAEYRSEAVGADTCAWRIVFTQGDILRLALTGRLVD